MEQEKNQLIQRFAEVQKISYESANEQIGGDSEEEILQNINNFTKQRIYSNLNRAQRRALKKQKGKNTKQNQNNIEQVVKVAQQLNYIDLIQRLRKLNEEKGEEKINEDTNKDN